MKTLWKSFKITIAFCIFFSLFYILVLWIFAQFAGPNKGNAEVATLNGKVGFVPYETYTVGYGNSGFAFTNVALKATTAIRITDSFSLPIFAQAIWNPCLEDTHLVFDITLKP